MTIQGANPEPAKLDTISLVRLAGRDPAEIDKLARAAETLGLFYLDLRGEPNTDKEAELLPVVYAATHEYFKQPLDVKMRDHRDGQNPSIDRGFKYTEADESLELPSEEFINGTIRLPETISTYSTAFSKFHDLCDYAARVLASSLSGVLSIPVETYHRRGEPSESGLKLISEPTITKQCAVKDNKHTDSGTLTLNFYDRWSIHAEIPREGRWAFVQPPEPGFALVNAGDFLRCLSLGRLHAPLHRVTQPYDGAADRYLLAYFLRPETSAQKAFEMKS